MSAVPSQLLSKEETVRLRNKHIGKAAELFFHHDPLKIVRAKGQYMYDENGNVYLDCINNVAHVGHCHPDVVDAEIQQTSLLNTNSRFLHDNLVLYAQQLTSLFPEPLSVCFFVNSGSEANDLAMQLARHHTKHKDIIAVEHAYHGNLSSLVGMSTYKLKDTKCMHKPNWIHFVPCPDTYRGKYVYDEDEPSKDLGLLYADEVRQTIDTLTKDGRNVAAFIAESILSCGGQIIPPPSYLSNVFKHVHAAGGICIIDEVQIGFGRTGKHWWGFQLQVPDVIPDIVTLGKPMGNGYPMSAVITTPAIADSFAKNLADSVMGFFSTFGGNPVSCAVAMSVLNVIEKENLREKAANVGSHLLNLLNNLKVRHSLIGDVRGIGLFVGIELVTDRKLKIPATKEARYVVNEMRTKGVLLSNDGPDKNVLKLKPPMVFNINNAEEFTSKLDEVLSDLESNEDYSRAIHPE